MNSSSDIQACYKYWFRDKPANLLLEGIPIFLGYFPDIWPGSTWPFEGESIVYYRTWSEMWAAEKILRHCNVCEASSIGKVESRKYISTFKYPET